MQRHLLIIQICVLLAGLAACSSPPTREPNYQGTRDRSDRAYDDLDRQKEKKDANENKEEPER